MQHRGEQKEEVPGPVAQDLISGQGGGRETSQAGRAGKTLASLCRMSHLLQYMGWFEFLVVLPSFLAAQTLLPILHQPSPNWAVNGTLIQVNRTQIHKQMGHPPHQAWDAMVFKSCPQRR